MEDSATLIGVGSRGAPGAGASPLPCCRGVHKLDLAIDNREGRRGLETRVHSMVLQTTHACHGTPLRMTVQKVQYDTTMALCAVMWPYSQTNASVE